MYLILYHSMSGNTKALAELIHKYIVDMGHNASICNIHSIDEVGSCKHIIIGTFTWGEGELPSDFRNFLRWMLKENDFDLPNFSVFGTGDTQWRHFCRAVDETEYHISKKSKVLNKLKIEQHPINQKEKVEEFVRKTIKEVEI